MRITIEIGDERVAATETPSGGYLLDDGRRIILLDGSHWLVSQAGPGEDLEFVELGQGERFFRDSPDAVEVYE